MMKQFLTIGMIGFCLSPGYLTAQQKNNPVLLTAKIKGMEAGKQVYYKAVNGTKRDSLTTIAGGFSLGINIPEGEGDIYEFGIGKNASGDAAIKIYLEQGDVQITADSSSFKGVKLSGNQFFQDYNEAGHDVQAEIDKKLVVAKNESFDGNVSKEDANEARRAGYYMAMGKWVKAHPGSTYAAVFLCNEGRYLFGDADVKTYFNALLPATKNNMPSKSLEKRIKREKVFKIGDMAPDFTLPDASGKLVSLKDFRGKYVLVYFWKSSDRWSREVHTDIGNNYMQYGAQGDFTSIGISVDEAADKDKWLKAIKEDEVVWPQLADFKGMDSEAAEWYGVMDFSRNFLVDPQGKIIGLNLFNDRLYAKLAELIKIK